MLVEVEIHEDQRGLGYYCGDLDKNVLEAIVAGTYSQPFIRLTDVFWPASRTPKEEYDEEMRYVVRYGSGDYQNYIGDMYIKKENIVLISPLRSIADRDGKKLGDLSAEKKLKGAF